MADAAPYDQLIPGIGYEFHDVTNLFLEAASGERFFLMYSVPWHTLPQKFV